MSATLSIKLKDDNGEWEVSTPITILDIKTLDWIVEALQRKLTASDEGRHYLDN